MLWFVVPSELQVLGEGNIPQERGIKDDGQFQNKRETEGFKHKIGHK